MGGTLTIFPRGNAELSSQTSPWSLSCSSMGLWGGYLFLIYPFKTMTTFDCRSIDKVASSQLILDKTCLHDFGFSPEICADLQHHDANNTVVQVLFV